jgi:hypothetical protein
VLNLGRLANPTARIPNAANARRDVMVHAMNYSVEGRLKAPSGWHRHDAAVAKWREALGDNKAPPAGKVFRRGGSQGNRVGTASVPATMDLIEVLFRNDAIELKYDDQGEHIVLIITPGFVASRGAPRPTLFEPQSYIMEHATELEGPSTTYCSQP